MGTVGNLIAIMNFKPILILVLVALLAQPNEGRRRRSNNSCTRHNQCYTGRCIRHNDYICGLGSFIRNIFGGGRRRKQKICHSYKCAQCTSNRHCYGNQYCSGYTCVSPQTYTNHYTYTTTTKSPFYNYNDYSSLNTNNYKDYNNLNTNNYNYEFKIPKNNYVDTSKYFDTSSFNTNFDTSYTAAD